MWTRANTHWSFVGVAVERADNCAAIFSSPIVITFYHRLSPVVVRIIDGDTVHSDRFEDYSVIVTESTRTMRKIDIWTLNVALQPKARQNACAFDIVTTRLYLGFNLWR